MARVKCDSEQDTQLCWGHIGNGVLSRPIKMRFEPEVALLTAKGRDGGIHRLDKDALVGHLTMEKAAVSNTQTSRRVNEAP